MTHDQRHAWKMWVRAALIRMARVSAAAAVATIGAEAVFSEVRWDVVAGVTVLAAIVEGLVCIAGLPEAPFPADLFGTDDGEDIP